MKPQSLRTETSVHIPFWFSCYTIQVSLGTINQTSNTNNLYRVYPLIAIVRGDSFVSGVSQVNVSLTLSMLNLYYLADTYDEKWRSKLIQFIRMHSGPILLFIDFAFMYCQLSRDKYIISLPTNFSNKRSRIVL